MRSLLLALSLAVASASQVTPGRPIATLADIPRGAWFRDASKWPSSDDAKIWGRDWSLIVSVHQSQHTDWRITAVTLGNGAVATIEDLNRDYVYTRDPFVPSPVEWPCRIGAEKGDGL